MRNIFPYIVLNTIACTFSVIFFYICSLRYNFELFRVEELLIIILLVDSFMIPTFSLSYSYVFDNKKCFKERVKIYKILKNNNDLVMLADDLLTYDYYIDCKKHLNNELDLFLRDYINVSKYDIDDYESRYFLINEIKNIKCDKETKKYKKILIADLKNYKNNELFVSKVILDYEDGELIKKHLNDSISIFVTVISILISIFGIIGIRYWNELRFAVYIDIFLSLLINVFVEIVFYSRYKNYYLKVYEYICLDLEKIFCNK